jgi:PAS domain S-box-containing protein
VKEKNQKKKPSGRRPTERERRYRQLLELVPDAVLAVVHGRIRFANRAAARVLGAASAAELERVVYRDLVLSAEPLASGGERQKLRRLDDETIEIHAELQGGPALQRIVLRPVTELSETGGPTEEPFLMVTESVRDRALIMLDPVGDIVQWNAAAERITGYSAAEIIGRPLSALALSEKEARADDQALMRTAVEVGRAEHEGWKKRQDGSEYYGATSITPLFDRDRKLTGFGLLLRDLTSGSRFDTLLNEEQVRQAQRMEAVGRLASGIAHDFNNLLTAIHGHAQFLLEDLPESDPSRVDAEEILYSADRAAALTRQLLAFSRGKAAQPQSIDLNQIVTSMERLLRRVITENIKLVAMLDPAVWAVRADPSQIEQVLVNLIVNARDAMPNGGTITIKTGNTELTDRYLASREDVKPGRYAMIAVSDTGVGMDKETQAHIFEPFFTTKELGKGTGLGLSTVYGIVRQSGGHVFVYSEPGKGTTFKIYLPFGGGVMQVPATVIEDGQRAHPGETLLVVEDDPGVRALAKRALESRGYKVMVAASGTEALDVFQQTSERIALVLSDVMLPDTSGTALIEAIKAIAPGCRLLLMSGYTAEDVQRHGNALNVEFIEKPFTPDALMRKVREVIDAPGGH